MMEIQASELAIQNAKSAQVKEFAQMMVSDHTKASNNLMAAAKADGVSVSAQMTNKQGATVDALRRRPAPTSTTKYVQAQVMAHQEALQLMETYAANGDSPDAKAHAQRAPRSSRCIWSMSRSSPTTCKAATLRHRKAAASKDAAGSFATGRSAEATARGTPAGHTGWGYQQGCGS